jgi:hypothetical protein
MSRALASIVAAALLAAGCLVPSPPDGALKCADTQPRCPDGYECRKDTCFKILPPDMTSLPPDMTTPPIYANNCNDYCVCIGTQCIGVSGTFPSEGDCLSACMKLTQKALDCRVYHCTAAQADPKLHCPHALGQVPSICM